MTNAKVDLILTGGTILTLDPEQPTAQAVAISGGTILAVGGSHDVRDWRQAGTEVIDVHGGAITPGLVDSHIHPSLALDLAAGTDLSACTDLDAVTRTLASAAHDLAADEWVQGWGLDPNAFAGAPVSAAAIDAAVQGRPAVLRLFDGHAVLVSSEALRRAGITGARTFSSTASIVTDAAGAPTGLLLEEDAVDVVAAVMPTEPFAARLDRLATILDHMAAAGLTGGHMMDANGDSLELLTALEEQERLPLRLRVAPWCRPGDDTAGIEALIDLQGRAGRLWDVAGVKLFMDGTIDGGTAWLREPDCHGESTRPYWLDPGDYRAAVARLHAAGVPTATHAIGDAAVTYVLDTIQALPGRGTVRHRVEHIETLPDDQIGRFGQLGVIASMQPTHATDYTRADHSDNWSTRLGPARAANAWRCADILHAGAVVALGSDWPIAPYDPRATLAAAQLRRPASRPDLGPVNASQALTATEALIGYTRAPAYAASAEHLAGRIQPGYRADLTVFADNPLATPPQDLPDVAVTHTLTAGRIYRHGAS